MYYICIENNKVISVAPYEPAVPDSVRVTTISDDEHSSIIAETHQFDVSTNLVIPVDAAVLLQKEKDRTNAIEREFLNSTDWQVLRHLRQLKLNEPTSLTEEEYLELERQRSAAAARIV